MPSSLSQAWSGADLGHVSVIKLLHSLSELVLVGLGIHNEHKCIALSSSLLTQYLG